MVMEKMLGDSPFVVSFIDHVTLSSANIEKHQIQALEVIKRLTKYGLPIRVDKCCFGQKKLAFWGTSCRGTVIEMDPMKVESIFK